MKGIVFAEFIEHASSAFGEDEIEDLIDECDLPSGGAYTAVGTYDFQEMVTLVTALSKQTGVSVDDLIHGFGVYLGGSFRDRFRDFFDQQASLFDFLDSVENHIHVEVRKLYADAELPSLKMVSRGENEAVLRYRSKRCLAQLASGLIQSAANHFDDQVEVVMDHAKDECGTFTDIKVRRQT